MGVTDSALENEYAEPSVGGVVVRRNLPGRHQQHCTGDEQADEPDHHAEEREALVVHLGLLDGELWDVQRQADEPQSAAPTGEDLHPGPHHPHELPVQEPQHECHGQQDGGEVAVDRDHEGHHEIAPLDE